MLLCETGPAEHTNVFWVIVSLFAFRDLKTLSGHLWALSVFPLVVHYYFFALGFVWFPMCSDGSISSSRFKYFACISYPMTAYI